MTVKAYVARDHDYYERLPQHSHELSGAVTLLQRLAAKFGDAPEQYVVIVNLRSPSADMLVLSALGMGVVELKHNTGMLRANSMRWFTEFGPVKAGAESKGFTNPREQVQSYASDLREIAVRRCAAWWSLTEYNLAKHLRVQSAVCFTHPGLTIPAETKAAIAHEADSNYNRLGRFDILVPTEFPAWAASLRFEVVENAAHGYRPYRLEAHQIAEFINIFHGTEWRTVNALLPDNRAYAYLMVNPWGHEPQIFSLLVLDLFIGRSASSCALTVPRGHGCVSRVHARLTRYGDQIWLQDLQSSHGTFVNGVRLHQATMLSSGDQITLGGSQPGPGIYTCEFVRRLPDDVQATETLKEPH